MLGTVLWSPSGLLENAYTRLRLDFIIGLDGQPPVKATRTSGLREKDASLSDALLASSFMTSTLESAEPRYIDVRTLSNRLGEPVATVLWWQRHGLIPVAWRTPGLFGRPRFVYQDVLAALEANKTPRTATRAHG